MPSNSCHGAGCLLDQVLPLVAAPIGQNCQLVPRKPAAALPSRLRRRRPLSPSTPLLRPGPRPVAPAPGPDTGPGHSWRNLETSRTRRWKNVKTMLKVGAGQNGAFWGASKAFRCCGARKIGGAQALAYITASFRGALRGFWAKQVHSRGHAPLRRPSRPCILNHRRV